MTTSPPALVGRYVRLEPLGQHHVPALVAAADGDPGLYRWTVVPQGEAAATLYVDAALAARGAGTAAPFAIVRLADATVVGSTRLCDMERWSWPPGHPRHGRDNPDVGEIGYTWLARSAVRTGANTEAKLLLLGHAVDRLGVLRVCLHTDSRNVRARAAIERIGARFEGILRAHRLAPDDIARDSARFSIIESEWPAVKLGLRERLDRG
jgi:RimJ/RimL family protein N-acetyltransferase